MSFSKKNRSHTFNGILFVALFALSSLYLTTMPFIKHLGLSPLIIAILLGIFYGNTLHNRLPKQWHPGIKFCSKKILQIAIILYGFRITIQQIASIGFEGLFLDIFIVVSTLIIGIWLGSSLFKFDRDLSLLISSGSAICGAAAVLAMEDVIKSEPYKATIAVVTVVIFGTLAMFLYPIAQHAALFGFSDTQYGLFTGASIHEVAQAVVASERASSEASNIAVIVKMTRVLLLIPTLLFFAYFFSKPTKSAQKRKLAIPWFTIGFGIVIGFHSLKLLPDNIIEMINQFDIFLLTMAMTAIGMETNLKKVKEIGLKPLYLACILFVWLIGATYAMIHIIEFF